ncbi:hypothetical protein DFS34DRAFT_288879 [Phlyctochytrium arcticum]|nr:hypothetical protein DFS34DRAFT_288879 [Phlyctochytrium arcticum]
MLFILTETSYRSSQRLAQTALGCVGKLARRAQGSKDREQLALILIDFAATQTAHPQHITYVLEFLSRSISESDEDSLFAAESSLSFRLGTLLVATLLKHPLWNVRDTAADFIGQFFLAPMCNHAAALTFAVRHDLPKHLLALCDDEQAFVRSTCLVAVRRVISHPRGFIYLDAHGLLPQEICCGGCARFGGRELR